MPYHSTNRHLPGGSTKAVTFSDALLQGLAPDGGLYMPHKLPTLSSEEIADLAGASYAETATRILSHFVENSIDTKALKGLMESAYASFDMAIDKIPVEGKELYLARLDQGPTASFKDFAAQAMSRLMLHFKPADQPLTVLAATSGDTGSAVAHAFLHLPNVKVYVLFPEQEVSPVQRMQLVRAGGNVQAIAIDGKFDDCQKLVKQAFADDSLKDLYLTSANSINVGRVLPQVVYYFYMYHKVATYPEPVTFCVPSGNLGNSLGCQIAKKMGLPVHELIIATNRNDAFPAYLNKGNYRPIVPSKACPSNAMNVGNPSNLARYFELYGGTVDKDGIVHKAPDYEQMTAFLKGYSISDEENLKTIKAYYQQYNMVVDPHAAVGLAAVEKHGQLEQNNQQNQKTIALQTAHPAKFPEVVEAACGIVPDMPQSLKELAAQPENVVSLSGSYEDFKNFMRADRFKK